MAAESGQRIDSASRVIKASPRSIYQAHMDPHALVSWLPPQGMTARIDAYDPREGGTYRIRHEDHEAGLTSTLENLAVFTEDGQAR